jgi:hypothetical protein
MLKSHACLQDSGQAGGAFGVSNNSFDGADIENIVTIRIRILRVEKCHAYRLSFLGVASRRTSSMCLEILASVTLVRRIETSSSIGVSNEGRLCASSGHGYARRSPILVDRCFPDDAFDVITVLKRRA